VMEKQEAVGGALSAATFAPDIRPSTRRVSGFEKIVGLSADMQQRIRDKELNQRLEEHRKEFRDYLAVDGNPTLAELGITGRLAERLQARHLDTLKKIERYGDRKRSMRANLATIKGVSGAQAAEVDRAARRWQAEHGVELWRVTARVEALSDLDYAVFVDDLKKVVEPVLAAYRARGVRGIEAVYTGLVPLVYKTQHELLWGLFKSLALAFVLIALVMMVILKSWRAGLLSMIPNLFPVAVVFGVMGWAGALVDVGAMMCASVALGIAVDDTMHYLTWFRKGLDEGLDREGAAMMAYERCATAMTQTTLIGGLGLAVFMFSTFTPTQQFGVMMLVLLSAALFGDLVFLPALLTGPLGRSFGSPKQPKPSEEPLPEQGPPEVPVEKKIVSLPVPTHAGALHFRSDVPHQSH
jgi:predicted RND superfamily exporter protein